MDGRREVSATAASQRVPLCLCFLCHCLSSALGWGWGKKSGGRGGGVYSLTHTDTHTHTACRPEHKISLWDVIHLSQCSLCLCGTKGSHSNYFDIPIISGKRKLSSGSVFNKTAEVYDMLSLARVAEEPKLP